MRRTDRGDALDGRLVVEQHAAAAVDLRIDEAGNEPAVLEVDRVRRRTVECGYRHDPAALDRDRRAGQQGVGGDDRAVYEMHLQRTHTVFVTLLRWSGASGLSPRRSESALAIR